MRSACHCYKPGRSNCLGTNALSSQTIGMANSMAALSSPLVSNRTVQSGKRITKAAGHPLHTWEKHMVHMPDASITIRKSRGTLQPIVDCLAAPKFNMAPGWCPDRPLSPAAAPAGSAAEPGAAPAAADG